MKNTVVIALSVLGFLGGCLAAFLYSRARPPLPPVFSPAADPYPNGIYTEGIIESDQPSGENIPMFPEVGGTVKEIPVKEGQRVRKGQTVLILDESIPRAAVEAASATLKSSRDTWEKDQAAYALDPRAVSRDALDSARDAVLVARGNLDSQLALLSKYRLRAPRDGTVQYINVAVGDYVSPQGTWGTYIEGAEPALSLAGSAAALNVRCYVDEILVSRLPPFASMKAHMFVRGSKQELNLSFLRVQPYVRPKIELSDERQELVDVRVLPIVFRIEASSGVPLYPGELVDVYIGE